MAGLDLISEEILRSANGGEGASEKATELALRVKAIKDRIHPGALSPEVCALIVAVADELHGSKKKPASKEDAKGAGSVFPNGGVKRG